MVTGRATGFGAVALLLIWTVGACGGSSPPDLTSTPVTQTSTVAPDKDRFSATPPDRDLIDLAMRFRGLPADTARLARTIPFDYELGASEEFFVFDLSDEPDVVSVTATLRYVTDHAYFFVQADRQIPESTMETIGSDFEEVVYPAVTEAFGNEWTPGVDSDPRMTILHADLPGLGGYFASANEFPASIVPFSNEREMLILNIDILSAPGDQYNTLAAHELQHMIHWQADFGEESWVNEGLSQVAAGLVAGGTGSVAAYLASPDTGLLDWPELGQTAASYAASQLFFSYLLDQYGGHENAAAILAEPLDGVQGIQRYLDGFSVEFVDVFANWLAATSIDDDSGIYAHIGAATAAVSREFVDSLGASNGTVSQFGAAFLEIEVAGTTSFIFDGAETAAPPAPILDGPYYWSNDGDAIDTTMTREFDLSNVESATLTFDAWYEIERGWDFAYVAASTDDGATWQALKGTQTSDYDPTGQAYGDGYTGSSDGWVEESIDLSGYAGGSILIRFEYVTDDSTSLTGFAVDNIEVPEIGFRAGGDTPAGWQGEGFHIVDGPTVQEWLLQVIDHDTGEVRRIELNAANETLPGRALSGPSTIIISAVSEGTRTKADYSWRVIAIN